MLPVLKSLPKKWSLKQENNSSTYRYLEKPRWWKSAGLFTVCLWKSPDRHCSFLCLGSTRGTHSIGEWEFSQVKIWLHSLLNLSPPASAEATRWQVKGEESGIWIFASILPLPRWGGLRGGWFWLEKREMRCIISFYNCAILSQQIKNWILPWRFFRFVWLFWF